MLAAVGNHEGKALTYLAMEPGEHYGISALHRLFLEIQGDPPAFAGQLTLQQKYCIFSFEPAGLTGRSERGALRHFKTDPDDLGTALAGHVLGVTEASPASLSQIFGKTSAPGTSEGADRPPGRRLAVLRALSQPGAPAYTADVARATGLSEFAAGNNLAALGRAGLLTYRSGPTYAMKSVYRVTRPLRVSPAGHNVSLETVIIDYLNGRLAARGGGRDLVVPRADIEAHVDGHPGLRGKTGVADRVQKVMIRLADRGELKVLQTYADQSQHSQIEVSAGQREFIARLAGGLDRLAAGDPDARREGAWQAREIIGDPARVRALVAKGYGSLKRVVNPLTAAVKKRRVLEALAAGQAVTSEVLLERLGDDFNPPLLRGTINELVKDGLVRGVKQPDGPYKLWYFA